MERLQSLLKTKHALEQLKDAQLLQFSNVRDYLQKIQDGLVPMPDQRSLDQILTLIAAHFDDLPQKSKVYYVQMKTPKQRDFRFPVWCENYQDLLKSVGDFLQMMYPGFQREKFEKTVRFRSNAIGNDQKWFEKTPRDKLIMICVQDPRGILNVFDADDKGNTYFESNFVENMSANIDEIVEKYEKEEEALRKQIKEIATELDRLKDLQVNWGTEKVKLENEIAQLKKDLKTIVEERDQASSQTDLKTRQLIDSLEKQIEALTQQVQTLENDKNALTEEKSKYFDSSRSENEERGLRIETLEKEKRDLEEKYLLLKSQSDESLKQKGDLFVKQIDDLKQSLVKEKEKYTRDLQNEQSKYLDHISKLEETKRMQDLNLDNLNLKIYSLNQEITRLTNELQSARQLANAAENEKISILNKQINELNIKIKTKEVELKTRESEIGKLNSKLEGESKLKTRIDELEKEIAGLKADKSKLDEREKQIEKLNFEKKRQSDLLADEVNKARKGFNELQKSYSEKVEESKKQQQKIKDLEKQIEKLENEKNLLNQTKGTVDQTLLQTTNEISTLKNKIKSLEKDDSKYLQQINALENQRDKSKEDLITIQAGLNQLKQQIALLEEQKKQLDERLKASEEKYENLRVSGGSYVNKLAKEKSELETKIGKLERELEQTKIQLKDAVSDTSKTTRIRELEQELKKKQKEIDELPQKFTSEIRRLESELEKTMQGSKNTKNQLIQTEKNFESVKDMLTREREKHIKEMNEANEKLKNAITQEVLGESKVNQDPMYLFDVLIAEAESLIVKGGATDWKINIRRKGIPEKIESILKGKPIESATMHNIGIALENMYSFLSYADKNPYRYVKGDYEKSRSRLQHIVKSGSLKRFLEEYQQTVNISIRDARALQFRMEQRKLEERINTLELYRRYLLISDLNSFVGEFNDRKKDVKGDKEDRKLVQDIFSQLWQDIVEIKKKASPSPSLGEGDAKELHGLVVDSLSNPRNIFEDVKSIYGALIEYVDKSDTDLVQTIQFKINKNIRQ